MKRSRLQARAQRACAALFVLGLIFSVAAPAMTSESPSNTKSSESMLVLEPAETPPPPGGLPPELDTPPPDGDGPPDCMPPDCMPPDLEFSSTVSIRYMKAKKSFRGTVSSDEDGCKTTRSVKLFKKRSGKDRLIGRDTTGATGNWQVRVRNARGRYYSRVMRRSFTHDSGLPVACLAAKSRILKR